MTAEAKTYSKASQLARAGNGIGLPKAENNRFRKVASGSELAAIRARKMGRCYVCRYLGLRQVLPSSLHHVVARARAGDDVAENLVPVCGHGTAGHHGLLEAHDHETCRVFAAALQQFDDAAYAYAIEKLGEFGFVKRYHVEFEAVS